MKELIHKMCTMRGRTVVLSKFCRYGCSIGRRMSFLYRIAISEPSMTTSGVRRPHIMPPQNIREPPPCCTCWTVCLTRSAWPDCLQTRLRRLSGWRHMRHSSVNRTWFQFWRVYSACFWAHLYIGLGVKCGPRHGRQEWSCASCSLFHTVWVETRCPVASETSGKFPWWEPFLTQRNNADTNKHQNWPSRHGRTTDNMRSVPPSWWNDWNWSAVLPTLSQQHCPCMVVYNFVQI